MVSMDRMSTPPRRRGSMIDTFGNDSGHALSYHQTSEFDEQE